MANEKHVEQLEEGVEAWNAWRAANPDIRPDLSGANLRGREFYKVDLDKADLHGADLEGTKLKRAGLYKANLRGANLRGKTTTLHEAYLYEAHLDGADLSKADLSLANFCKAFLCKANLQDANLEGANFHKAKLGEAKLCRANLSRAGFINTDLRGADLTGCRVYGTSAWEVELKGTEQRNLVITRANEPEITVDNIEVAQFIHLLLRNEKIRDVLDTITAKAVLILGRFTPERKTVLDALRDKLHNRGYLPILFDFEKPTSQNLTATIMTLARLARFIIADLTDPSSIPYELGRIVPITKVPVQPILLSSSRREFAMFRDLQDDYHWALPIHHYDSLEQLISDLGERVINPAERKVLELHGGAKEVP